MKEIARDKLYEVERFHNFRELIYNSAKEYGDKTAFTYKKQPKDTTYITHSYLELKNDIESLSTSLLNLKLAKKRVAIIAPNRYEWCVSYLAVTTGGMVVVPLDKALPDNEIEDSIIRSEVEAIVFDKKYLGILNKIKTDNKSLLKHFICMDFEKSTETILSYSELIQEGKQLISSGDTQYQNVVIDPNAMSIMLFTSGTTSLAKIVMLSQNNICSNIYSIGCIAKVTSEDTFLSFLPLHHTFECTTTFLYGLSCGITVAFCDGLRYIVQNLKEYKVTGLVCVPLMLEAMYKKIQKGIAKKHMTTLFNIMSCICNFLLKLGVDIRRKVFKSVINELGRLPTCYCLWRCTYG